MSQMSTGPVPGPRKNKLGCGCGFILLMVAVVLILRFGQGMNNFPSGSQVSSTATFTPAPESDVAAVRAMLTPTPGLERREGTAAIILVDVSGSMNESVADADGRPRAKIDIARRCAADIVRQTEEFAAGQKDAKVLLGVSEFSSGGGRPNYRSVVPLGPPSLAKAQPLINAMRADGGTPIGDSIIAAKKELDATMLSKLHVLVVTDGKNTDGRSPGLVAKALTGMAFEQAASLHFVAFDIDPSTFGEVQQAGVIVNSAADAKQLKETLDFLLAEKILLEKE